MLKIISDLTTYLQNLSKDDFEKQMILFLGVILLLVGSITFFIYRKSSSLVTQITNLHNLARKSAGTLTKYYEIQDERKRVLTLLEKEKDFEIKSFFEKFCRQHQVKPISDWSTPSTPVEGNDVLEEISLRARFKNQTTKQMVMLLDDLGKTPMVYVNELKIKAGTPEAGTKKITFELSIATLRYKQAIEE